MRVLRCCSRRVWRRTPGSLQHPFRSPAIVASLRSVAVTQRLTKELRALTRSRQRVDACGNDPTDSAKFYFTAVHCRDRHRMHVSQKQSSYDHRHNAVRSLGTGVPRYVHASSNGLVVAFRKLPKFLQFPSAAISVVRALEWPHAQSAPVGSIWSQTYVASANRTDVCVCARALGRHNDGVNLQPNWCG